MVVPFGFQQFDDLHRGLLLVVSLDLAALADAHDVDDHVEVLHGYLVVFQENVLDEVAERCCRCEFIIACEREACKVRRQCGEDDVSVGVSEASLEIGFMLGYSLEK